MNGIDHVVLAGNITQNPVINREVGKRTQLFINIAVNREFKQPDGTIQKRTDFIPVSVFGKYADSLVDGGWLVAGKCVFVQAHHVMRDKFKISIVADNIQLVSATKEAGQQPAADISEIFSNDFDDI